MDLKLKNIWGECPKKVSLFPLHGLRVVLSSYFVNCVEGTLFGCYLCQILEFNFFNKHFDSWLYRCFLLPVFLHFCLVNKLELNGNINYYRDVMVYLALGLMLFCGQTCKLCMCCIVWRVSLSLYLTPIAIGFSEWQTALEPSLSSIHKRKI